MNVLRIQKAKAEQGTQHKAETSAKDETQLALEKMLYIGREFNNYDEVEEMVKILKTKYFFPLRIENCNTVKAYNNNLKNKIDESMRYRRVVFVCIHYGLHRSRSQKMLRVNQNVFAKNCPFTFTVVYIAHFKKLVITELNIQHANHAMSADHMKLYHRTKKLSDEAQTFIRASLEANMAPAAIRKAVLSNFDVHLKTKDIYNLKHKYMAVEPANDWKETCATLEELSRDPSNFAHVFLADDSTVQGIYVQLKEQRIQFAKFGDVCFIDGSFSISKGDMTMYAIIVVDNNGNNQPAAFFLVKNSSPDSVKSCLELFVKNNDTSKIRTVVVNKYGEDLDLYSSIFSSARVLPCQAFVNKTVDTLLAKIPMGGDQRRKLQQKFKRAAHTTIPEEFEKYKGKLTSHEIAGELYNFWFEKAELWATVFRKTLFTLQNTSTNRIERFHKLVKETIPCGTAISLVIKGIIAITKGNVRESDLQNLERDIKSPKTKHDEFNSFLAELTPFAAGLVFTQFKRCNSGVRIVSEDESGFAEVASNETGGTTFRVSNDLQSCTCIFFHSVELPCQHILHVRKIKKLPVEQMICNKRWKQEQEEPEGIIVEIEAVEVELTKEEKHAKAMEILVNIADVLSDMSKDDFNKNMLSLMNLKTFIEQHQTIEFIECGNVTNVLEEDMEVPDDNPEEAPGDTPKEATGDVSDEATGEATDEATDVATDVATEEAPVDTPEEAPGDASDESTDDASDEVLGEVSDDASQMEEQV